MKYTADYFIKKLGKIPEDKWCIGFFVLGEKRCALGHLLAISPLTTSPLDIDMNPVAEAFINLFVDELGVTPGSVNDGSIGFYSQHTPKGRVIAALRDIRKAQKRRKN